jgi:hypothetical protein
MSGRRCLSTWLTLQNFAYSHMSGRLAQGGSSVGRTGAGVHGRGLAAAAIAAFGFPWSSEYQKVLQRCLNCVFTSSCSDLQMEPSVL